MTRSALLLTVLLLFGCNRHAQSQQATDDRPPQRPETTNVNDAVYQSRQTAITRAVAAAAPAVVSVSVIEVQRVRYRDPFSDPWFDLFFGRRRSRTLTREVKSVGSGFIISPDGYIVTNEHVAGGATKITVSLRDGTALPAELVGSDAATDIALLKVDTDAPLPYLPFSATEEPLVGEWAIALGNPFGLFEAAEPTVTVGVVSAVDRDFEPQEGRVYRDMIQTDAAINRGNSGGPLVNAMGEVIGLNAFIFTQQGGGSIGLGFAVPARKVQQIVDELKENGFIDRSYYTGLYGDDVDERIARALDLPAARGVFVRDLDPGSPAAKAGFAPYDVIVGVEGEVIGNRNDFIGRLYDFRPGDRLRVEVVRDGRRVELTLRLGSQSS